MQLARGRENIQAYPTIKNRNIWREPYSALFAILPLISDAFSFSPTISIIVFYYM